MNNADSVFARQLKVLRKEKKLTQVKLADALGVSKGAVAMWEVGKREPGFKTLVALADLFKCDIDCLLGPTPDEGWRQSVNELPDDDCLAVHEGQQIMIVNASAVRSFPKAFRQWRPLPPLPKEHKEERT